MPRRASWRWIIGLTVGACAALLPGATETAIANGDTRTLNLYHAHTHETISATYLVNGQYDQGVLDKLNWFLRDWRRDEPTKMDPRLFDTVWEVYRESGSQQPIEVMSAYRSPETNAMLRRRSRQVAEHSQHILGKAMDQHYMDVPMSRIRELGMRLQRGGVGFYPTAGTPFVHLDVGGVRHWPRMSYDQLARLFPDGKTVHIPSNGQPLPGYEEARAELEARGDGSYPTASQLKSKGFFAWLFGGGGGDEEEDNEAAGVRGRPAAPQRGASGARVAAVPFDASGGGYGKSAQERGVAVASGSEPPKTLFSMLSQPTPAAPPLAPAPAPAQPAAAPVTQQAFTPAPALVLPRQPAPATPPEVPVLPVLPSLPVADPHALPLPPRRPTELAAVEADAPLPPARPSGLPANPHDAVRAATPGAKPDAIGSLLSSTRVARLPDVITQGTGTPGKALGYAAQPGLDAPMPVARPTALLSAHLDRSNFRALTRPDSTERGGGRSALGAALPPLRAAMKSDLNTLGSHPAKATSFQARASDLTTHHFSGSVVKPSAQAREDAKHTTLD